MKQCVNNKTQIEYTVLRDDVLNVTNIAEQKRDMVLFVDSKGRPYVIDKLEFAEKFTICQTR